ncbi:Translin [Fomitiporia mediterranea MF3/22]|uniref:Translin n=1 Tax=Fomitiporia mediterranea (strain MF3/22) TaxID=694068 RepID=UPI00044078A6|nr:Translin [Fomitiporia mediterranea MF3/22]EJD04301.1 Translin [Fomitiporia mediterranea MF3/22]
MTTDPSPSPPRVLQTHDEIVSAFSLMRDELDEHNDRRERLVKTSRDITIIAKRVIFLLHRLVTEASPTDPNAFTSAAAQGRDKLVAAQKLFRSMREDLEGSRFWHYQQAISPGLQEYIEALAFAHYVETGRLIGYHDVQNSLCCNDDENRKENVKLFPLPMDDYLLGVSDVTGELMRFAITAIGRRGGRGTARAVSDFVRNCKADFEGFTPYVRHLGKKQSVTAQSLQKIEDTAYAIAVRTSEYDLPEDMLDDIVEHCVSDVRRGGSSGRGRQRFGGGEYEEESEEDY